MVREVVVARLARRRLRFGHDRAAVYAVQQRIDLVLAQYVVARHGYCITKLVK
jgi:hypothetical protein